jgi:PAS domain-containing protein
VNHLRSTTILKIQDFVSAMRLRAAALRERTSEGSAEVLAEAFAELETTQEELTVAEEELRAHAERAGQASLALAGELRMFRELFDHSPDGYARTDGRGVVRIANRTLATQLNIHPRFLENKPLINFVARADCKPFRALLMRLGEGGQQPCELRVRLRPRNGRPPFYADVRVVAREGNGGVYWAIRPVSDQPAASSAPLTFGALVDATVDALAVENEATPGPALVSEGDSAAAIAEHLAPELLAAVIALARTARANAQGNDVRIALDETRGLIRVIGGAVDASLPVR